MCVFISVPSIILLLDKGKGRIMAISTSNTKKISVITKNRREKEFRILCDGSNPHSNGDIFSRCFVILDFKICDSAFRITIKIILHNKKFTIILLFFVKFFDWKSNILLFVLITKKDHQYIKL